MYESKQYKPEKIKSNDHSLRVCLLTFSSRNVLETKRASSLS